MYVFSVKNKILKLNSGSHEDKNVNIIDKMMLPCCVRYTTLVHETHQYTPQGLDTFGLIASILHISMHTTA